MKLDSVHHTTINQGHHNIVTTLIMIKAGAFDKNNQRIYQGKYNYLHGISNWLPTSSHIFQITNFVRYTIQLPVDTTLQICELQSASLFPSFPVHHTRCDGASRKKGEAHSCYNHSMTTYGTSRI